MSDEDKDRPFDLWQWLDSMRDAALEFAAYAALIAMLVLVLFILRNVSV